MRKKRLVEQEDAAPLSESEKAATAAILEEFRSTVKRTFRLGGGSPQQKAEAIAETEYLIFNNALDLLRRGFSIEHVRKMIASKLGVRVRDAKRIVGRRGKYGESLQRETYLPSDVLDVSVASRKGSESHELRERIMLLVRKKKLSEKYANALLLRLEGQSNQEIARTMKVSEDFTTFAMIRLREILTNTPRQPWSHRKRVKTGATKPRKGRKRTK